MTPERLAAIHHQLQDFTETLRALADRWPSARPVALWWDQDRQVLATDSALGTYRSIYGNDLVRGLRHLWKSAKRGWRRDQSVRCHEPLRIDAALPPDAVAIPQRSQGPNGVPYVLTVVSAREQTVVKIFSRNRKDRFASELKAWHLAQAAGIGHRTPDLISSGESVNGFSWLVFRLVRNSGLSYPPVIGNWLWRRYLGKHILPGLQHFYRQAGVEVLSGCDSLDLLRAQIADHPMSEALSQVVELAEKARRRAGDDRVMLTLVHGDLTPHNVHRHGDQWWLIDWSMSRQAPVMVDLWPGASSALANKIFAAWLRGRAALTEVPFNLRAHLSMCAEWQDSWAGIKSDSDSLRFQILVTLLHRLSRVRWSIRTQANVTALKALGVPIRPNTAPDALSLST